MTKTLYNHDNHIVYMATKQDGSIEKKQISNYSLVGLFEIEQKPCTMNTNEITEKLALRLTKYFCLSKGYFLRFQSNLELIEQGRKIETELSNIIPFRNIHGIYNIDVAKPCRSDSILHVILG